MKTKCLSLELYLSHRAALVDFATPIVGCRARAEDVVQEAFIRHRARLARRHAAYRPISSPLAYLYRIVRNIAIDWRQRPDTCSASADEARLHRLSSPMATPEQTVIDRARLRVLAEALAELPERTRIAFDMHRLEGRSLQEIADHLGISVVRAHQLVKDAVRHGAARLNADD